MAKRLRMPEADRRRLVKAVYGRSSYDRKSVKEKRDIGRKMESEGYSLDSGVQIGNKTLGQYLTYCGLGSAGLSTAQKARLVDYLQAVNGERQKKGEPVIPIYLHVPGRNGKMEARNISTDSTQTPAPAERDLTWWERASHYFGTSQDRKEYQAGQQQTERLKEALGNRIAERRIEVRDAEKEREAFLKANAQKRREGLQTWKKAGAVEKQWNQIFFGSEKAPGDLNYSFGDGKTLDAFSACVGILAAQNPEAAKRMAQGPESALSDPAFMKEAKQAFKSFQDCVKARQDLKAKGLAPDQYRERKAVLDGQLKKLLINPSQKDFRIISEKESRGLRKAGPQERLELASQKYSMLRSKHILSQVLGEDSVYSRNAPGEYRCMSEMNRNNHMVRMYDAIRDRRYVEAQKQGVRAAREGMLADALGQIDEKFNDGKGYSNPLVKELADHVQDVWKDARKIDPTLGGGGCQDVLKMGEGLFSDTMDKRFRMELEDPELEDPELKDPELDGPSL